VTARSAAVVACAAVAAFLLGCATPPPPPSSVPPEFAPDPALDVKLGPPRPGEWRAVHPTDGGETFDAYAASGPVHAEPGCDVLAFQPVGEFDAQERATFEAATEFCGIWFGLRVRTLPPVPLTDDAAESRGGGLGFGRHSERQYRTTWFLRTLLPPRRPPDAVVLVGVTMADHFPSDELA
jgi:hypothetical protein